MRISVPFLMNEDDSTIDDDGDVNEDDQGISTIING